MVSKSSSALSSWFSARKIDLKPAWLTYVVSFLKDAATEAAVMEQFLHSNLRDSYQSPMNIPEKALKIVLTKPIVFQILSVMNIARPVYEQYREETRKDENLTWFYGEDDDEDDEAEHSVDSRPTSSIRFLRIEVSNGDSTLSAIEYGGFKQLSLDTVVGTKIMLAGRVMCRRGVMQLNDTNCVVLGGGIEGGGISRAQALAKILPKNPKPIIKPCAAGINVQRMKKEPDLNQSSISPFLVRMPRQTTVPSADCTIVVNDSSTSLAMEHASSSMHTTVVPRGLAPPPSKAPPKSRAPPPSKAPPNSRAPPPSKAPVVGSHRPLPPAAAVQPTVKQEETDAMEESVMVIAAPPYEPPKRLPLGCRPLPIIPDLLPKIKERRYPVRPPQKDIPVLSTARIVPHHLGLVNNSSGGRSIAAHFEREAARAEKKTQLVAPSRGIPPPQTGRSPPRPFRRPSLDYVMSTPTCQKYNLFSDSPIAGPSSPLAMSSSQPVDEDPLNLFRSPKRSLQQTEQSAAPCKKSKAEQPPQSTSAFDFSAAASQCVFTAGAQEAARRALFQQHKMAMRPPPSHQAPPPQQAPPSSQAPPPQMQTAMASPCMQPPSAESALVEKYLSLCIVRLAEAMKQRRFWMLSKQVVINPLRCRIIKDLAVDNENKKWTLFLDVADESVRSMRCSVDSALLDKILGFSVASCQEMSVANNRSELMKCKERACGVLRSLHRLDLVLRLTISPKIAEPPVVTEITNLADALKIF